MRIARTLAVGTAATLVLGAGLAAAEPSGDPDNSQTITITVEDAPLELEVNGGTVEFTVTAGETIAEADAIDPDVPDGGSPSTITFKNPLGSAVEDAKLSVTRTTPDSRLAEDGRDLTLRVSLDDEHVESAVSGASMEDLSDKIEVASWNGTETDTQELITGGLARGTAAHELTLTWKLHGDPGTTPTGTLNAGTFTFVISESGSGS